MITAAGFFLIAMSATVGPHIITGVFGNRYASAASALVPLSMAMTALAITTLGNTYLLATGHRWHAVGLIVLSLGALSLLTAAGGNFATTARWDFAIQLVVAIFVTAGVSSDWLRFRK
jgi:hypothetical protein